MSITIYIIFIKLSNESSNCYFYIKKKVGEQQKILIVCRNYNGTETNHYHSHYNTSIPVRHRKKFIIQKRIKQNEKIYRKNPPISTRRNTNHNNEIDFSMIRTMKIFEIERDLLRQTCDTIDRIKVYLSDRLLEMKDSYCIHLSIGETTGMAPESIYNRDLVADLLKLTNTVLAEANYDSQVIKRTSIVSFKPQLIILEHFLSTIYASLITHLHVSSLIVRDLMV
ncbi:unnamed protein product [Rotaria sp. Silwood1]|nr:unnamed protein product [Rotaria sp. Silwood1]